MLVCGLTKEAIEEQPLSFEHKLQSAFEAISGLKPNEIKWFREVASEEYERT